jgi:hypothetical protein
MLTEKNRLLLQRPLAAFRRKDLLRRVAEVISGLALAGWLAIVALALFERSVEPSLALRGALGGAVCVVALVSAGAGFLYLLRGLGDLQVAWCIERGQEGKLNACLATAVEYLGSKAQGGGNASLIEDCVSVALEELEGQDPSRGISFLWSQRAGGALVLLFLLFGGLVGWNPWAHYHLLSRFVAPGLGIEVPVPVRFLVQPGEIRILAGTRFQPTCQLVGMAPGELIAVRQIRGLPGERFSALSEEVGAAGTLSRFDFGAADQSFDYHFRLGAYRSASYRVEVLAPPRPTEVVLGFHFPAHTHLPDRIQRGGELDVVAPRGTQIKLTVTCNRPMRQATLRVLTRGAKEAQRIESSFGEGDRIFTTSMNVLKSGSWWIELEDVEGFLDPAPRHHRLVCEEDSLPRVYVLSPGKDLERVAGPGPKLGLKLHASDGYGLRHLSVEWTLRTRRSFRDQETSGSLPVPLAGEPNEVTTAAELDLSGFSLVPGDRISYRARVRDSRPGPEEEGVVFSHSYRIQVPFPRDEHAKLSEQEAEHNAGMEALVEQQRDWEKRLDRSLRDVSADGEISWKERRELETLLKEEKDLRRKVQDLAARMEESLDQARESGILEPEVEEKMEQVQEMLRKLADVDMHERMKELRELLNQVKVDQGKMKELRKRYDKEAHSKNLERMLEALKKLKTQQEIEKVRAQVEALVKDQEKLKQETASREEKGKEIKSLAKEQGALKERTEKVAQELEKLHKELGEESKSAAKDIEDAKDAMQKGDSAEKQMEEAQKQLQKQELGKAQRSQSRASRRLRQAQSSLQQAAKGLQSDRRAVNLQAVVRMVRLGLEVSGFQEKVVRDAWNSNRDPRKQCRLLASKQDSLYRGIHRFEGRFEESLQDELELKERFLTAVSDLVENFLEAKTAFEQIRPFTGRQLARTAMIKLNQILAELLDIQEEIQDSMASASQQQMMEQLRRMIKEQEMLNKQTERLKQKPGEAERKRQMAQEMSEDQGQLREQLEKLREEARAKRELEGMEGKLGELGKEMKEVEEALREMALTEELRRKQRRIVTRMLDLAASLQKQGESKKREARRPSLFLPPPPPPTPPDLEETRRRFFENQEREGAPLEDQEAVERYLDSLAEESFSEQRPDEGLDAAP